MARSAAGHARFPLMNDRAPEPLPILSPAELADVLAGLAGICWFRPARPRIGRPITRPHGTEAAYRRHRYVDEPVCEACFKAHRLRQQAYYQRQKLLDIRPESN